jgi:hypothetical protein
MGYRYSINNGVSKIKSYWRRAVLGIMALAFPMSMVVASGARAVVSQNYSLFGDAQIVSPGNASANAAQVRSDASVAPGYGGIDFPTTTTWANLTTLSADYNVTDDDCFGGSPRFSVDVDTTGDNVADGDVVVHFGPSPNFSGCAAGWQATGNLIGNNDAGRYDFSHLGGSGFTTYSNAPAAVQTGTVTGISLLVDSSWGFQDSEQTILIDNVNINTNTYDFEPVPTKESCKKDGWKTRLTLVRSRTKVIV